ncbi:MAG: hypothetical protein JWR80_3933 [Bradyrhizobium sp.]|nr:hypothetical protein [Bradyrhizobium sp.]
MAHRRLSREELHKLVWTRATDDLAADFGITKDRLTKICLRYHLDFPDQEHWQRIAAGEHVDRPDLPVTTGDTVVDIYGADPDLHPKLLPKERARLDALLERETLPEYRISPNTEGGRLHSMTKRIHEALRASRPDDYGCVRCGVADLPSVRILPATIPRALALLDAFIRAVEVRGLRWVPGSGEARWDQGASIEIEGVKHILGLHETTRRQIHRLTPKEREDVKRGYPYGVPQYDYVGTNQLSLRRFDFDEYVRDTASKTLEVRLNDLFAILINRTFRELEDQRKRELQAQQAATIAAQREEVARLRKIRAGARETLFAAANDWNRAQEVRAFLVAFEESLTAEEKLARSQWIEWARREMVALDPLTGADAKFLNVDPEALAVSDEQ